MFENFKNWHRYLSMLILLLLVYFFYGYFVSPLNTLSEDTYSRYMSLVDQKTRYQKVVSQSDVFEKQHQQLLLSVSTDSRFIRSASSEDAQLAFQKIILNLTQETGIQLTSINFLNELPDNNTTALKLQASLDHSQLQALLHNIESADLLVNVDKMKIEINPLSKVQRPQTSAAKLDVILDLSAIWFEMK